MSNIGIKGNDADVVISVMIPLIPILDILKISCKIATKTPTLLLNLTTPIVCDNIACDNQCGSGCEVQCEPSIK